MLEGEGKQLRLDGRPPFYEYGALVSNEGPASSPAEFTASYFTPGTWQLSSPGTTEAPPFAAGIRLPPQPRLLDLPSAVDRTKDLLVSWAPDGYEVSDVVDFEIASGIALVGLPGESTNHHISCRAPAADGGLTIRASLLQVLAADRAASLMIGISSGERTVTSFPLVNGGVGRSLLGFAFVQRYLTSVN